MDDRTIEAHIDDLLAEVQVLREKSSGTDEDDRQRLTELREQLDQSRDLLLQRQARRQLGEDPGLAQVRAVDEVEHQG